METVSLMFQQMAIAIDEYLRNESLTDEHDVH
eukprot:CAMPEP_0185789882 /NCGR_PEP_ID=MMETSP1174-20130828/153306_1 /TAXON_ID=35687 /ORGANISM="Dictyocha speculum, Strain CCMP1381" /LENGTH=31 /DNA_ID= /DNA_START= /DNA_END= /DNA_ORIENTATION=